MSLIERFLFYVGYRLGQAAHNVYRAWQDTSELLKRFVQRAPHAYKTAVDDTWRNRWRIIVVSCAIALIVAALF